MAATPCSSSISSSTPKPNASSAHLLLLDSSSLHPFISHRPRRGRSPPLICTATKHFGFTRSNTIRIPLLPLHKNNNNNNNTTPALASDAAAVQEQDTATTTIISALLFIAFVGLSILTIGVIYIAVTDFLQKREGEKFQKEEAEKKKKGGGKKRQQMKARAGPKGFGQKIVETEEDDI